MFSFKSFRQEQNIIELIWDISQPSVNYPIDITKYWDLNSFVGIKYFNAINKQYNFQDLCFEKWLSTGGVQNGTLSVLFFSASFHNPSGLKVTGDKIHTSYYKNIFISWKYFINVQMRNAQCAHFYH